jgi:hypothetical protein
MFKSFQILIPRFFGWSLDIKESKLLNQLLANVFQQCMDHLPDFKKFLSVNGKKHLSKNNKIN